MEGSLARKLCFYIFDLQMLKEVSHESFVFTSSRKFARKLPFHTFNLQIFQEARTKASFAIFAQLQLADFEGSLARKFRLHQLAARSRGKNAPHHRPEPCQPIVAQIPVFSYDLIPNSISLSMTYSITYSYYLIPITCVFTVKVGLLRPCVQKRKQKE